MTTKVELKKIADKNIGGLKKYQYPLKTINV